MWRLADVPSCNGPRAASVSRRCDDAPVPRGTLPIAVKKPGYSGFPPLSLCVAAERLRDGAMLRPSGHDTPAGKETMANKRRIRSTARRAEGRASPKPAFARRATLRKSAARRTPAAGHVTHQPGPGVASGVAPGMQPVSACLAVADVAGTVDFLEQAFGFARGVVLADPDGRLRYAEVRHGTSVVVVIRQDDETTPTAGTAALYTYVQDVDYAAMRAREAGAAVAEAADRPWGDRTAVVTDPNGYRWVLATFRKLAPFS